MRKFLNIAGVLLLLTGCSKDEAPKVPKAVNLVFPENNSECIAGISRSQTTSEVEFVWEATAHATRYELTVTRIGSGVFENVTTSNTRASLVIEKGAPYSWQVTARNASGQEGPPSASWQFYNAGAETTYPPFPAVIKSPASGESVTPDKSGEVTLLWSGADADADLAEFEVYFGTSASSLALQATLSPGQTSFSVPVVSGTIYFWEILSRDAEGNTSRSGVYSFRVL